MLCRFAIFHTILLNMLLFYEDRFSAIYKKWGSENKIIIKNHWTRLV